MNKIVLSLGILLAVFLAGFVLFGTSTSEYVAAVNDEVTGLENELKLIEAAVQAGTLSPETAAEMQKKVVARIEAVNTAMNAGQKAKLTDAQRAQLVEGLDRLKQILIKFKSTLVAVDDAVLKLPEDKRPKLKGNSGTRGGSVADIVEETLDDIEVVIEEITDEEILEEVEEIIETPADEVEEVTEETNEEDNEGSEATMPEDTETEIVGDEESTIETTEGSMDESVSTENASQSEDDAASMIIDN